MPTTTDPAQDLQKAINLYESGLDNSGLTPDTTKKIRELLNSAASASPPIEIKAKVLAWRAIIVLSDYLNQWNRVDPDEFTQAKTDATTAKQLASQINDKSTLALAHYAKGFYHRTKGDHDKAKNSFESAIQSDSELIRAYAHKAVALTNLGGAQNLTDALSLIDKAIRETLNNSQPNNSALGMFYWIRGRIYFFLKDYGNAQKWLKESIDKRDNLWYNRLYLVSACAKLSKNPEDDWMKAAKAALDAANKNRALFPAGTAPPFTLKIVETLESANPHQKRYRDFVDARQSFHDGLSKAGVPS